MKNRYISTLYLVAVLCLLTAYSSNAQQNQSIQGIPSSFTLVKHSSFQRTHYFCRIYGACRIGEGTILLPVWMKTYSEHLKNCGFPNISYSITAESVNVIGEDAEQDGVQAKSVVWRSSRPGMQLDDKYREQDLLDATTPSAERIELATIITPLLHMIDMFTRPSAYSAHTNGLCVDQSGKVPCSSSNPSLPSASPLSAVLFVDSRITKTKDFHWPKSVLRLMRSSLAGNFQTEDQRDVYSWKVRSKACCFRSILSTNVETAEMPLGVIAPGNIFFTENGLVRTSATQALHHAIARCVVKVLVLNRYGKRFIEGANLMSSAISAFSNVLAQSAPHVQIRPEVIFFENSSFHEQVSIVQEAGVVVATHGESNANFMFARPDTHVFEILPFGYLSDDYKNLSVPYGVNYHRVTAQPDRQVFKACVRHFNPKPTLQRENFLSKWDLYAAAFRNGTIEHGRNILSSFVVPEFVGKSIDSPGVVNKVRECAAQQRVSVDVRDLARSVVVSAARQCPIHTDLTMLQV